MKLVDYFVQALKKRNLKSIDLETIGNELYIEVKDRLPADVRRAASDEAINQAGVHAYETLSASGGVHAKSGTKRKNPPRIRHD